MAGHNDHGWGSGRDNRNSDAFNLAYREHRRELCRFAARFLQCQADAEDVVQDVFLRLWEQAEQINVRRNLRGYLYSSVRNTALNLGRSLDIRSRRPHRDVAIPGRLWQPVEYLACVELEQSLNAALGALNDKDRSAFTLNRDAGLTYAEIARQEGVAIKTVEVRIGRALRHLRTELAEYR